jgi:rfaE bifunctional protein nucleotidyltransferase chain/domain
VIEDKIISREEAARIAAEARRASRKVVFTNGCFDIIHVGHVKCLEAARSFGDLLMVGINSDESVRQLKGPERPLLPELDRAATIAGLESVSYVVIFEEPTPEALIEAIRPNVHVKGGDYQPEDMPETPLVRRLGGEVRIVPVISGRSTSAIIERAKKGDSCASSG